MAQKRFRLAVQHMKEKYAELNQAVKEAMRVRKEGREELLKLAKATVETQK